MYEFPPVSELNSLIGETLTQVGLDPYGIQFRFDPSHITAEFAVEQIEPDGAVWYYRCVAAEGSPIMLHRLVGKIIASIESEGLRLKIGFDNGARLHVLSQIGPYECGTMSAGGKFIVF
jgi:hypothetical protein